MIRRTIEVSGHDVSLALRLGQIVVTRQGEPAGQFPAEDVGVLIVDTPSAHYTHGAVLAMLGHGASIVLCDGKHMPAAIVDPLEGHHIQSERLRAQVEASLPTRKRLWQEIVQAKIRHQAGLHAEGETRRRLLGLAAKVRSGDPENIEAQAARLHWSRWLPPEAKFRRDRGGDPPNGLLNYGYMALRASVARSLAGAGLHPSLALRHQNRYNAFGLADDLMEPMRPLVDAKARELFLSGQTEITKETKAALLGLLTATVRCGGEEGPLMIGLERMAVSLARNLAGEEKGLLIPALPG